MTVFLATLGQRPEAITMALDVLLTRYPIDAVHILCTDVEQSDITEAYHALMDALAIAYPALSIQSEILCFPDGSPLIDITGQHSAEAYYHALLEVLRRYRVEYEPIHLLIAGGRKAMSVYATLAAVMLLGENDRVWTIHTPPDLMQNGVFHAPPGSQDRVQVIQLPVNPSRILPGIVIGQDMSAFIQRARTSPRQMFMASLTPEERHIAELLRQNPYAGNDELATIMGKGRKTVENQLGSIYRKLFSHFDLNIHHKHKRQALLDVLAGRV